MSVYTSLDEWERLERCEKRDRTRVVWNTELLPPLWFTFWMTAAVMLCFDLSGSVFKNRLISTFYKYFWHQFSTFFFYFCLFILWLINIILYFVRICNNTNSLMCKWLFRLHTHTYTYKQFRVTNQLSDQRFDRGRKLERTRGVTTCRSPWIAFDWFKSYKIEFKWLIDVMLI